MAVLGLHADRAAVALRDLLGDEQPEAEAGQVGGLLLALEDLEDAGLAVVADARALVVDRDLGEVAAPVERDRDVDPGGENLIALPSRLTIARSSRTESPSIQQPGRRPRRTKSSSFMSLASASMRVRSTTEATSSTRSRRSSSRLSVSSSENPWLRSVISAVMVIAERCSCSSCLRTIGSRTWCSRSTSLSPRITCAGEERSCTVIALSRRWEASSALTWSSSRRSSSCSRSSADTGPGPGGSWERRGE